MTKSRAIILVIEDDPQIRRFLRTALNEHDFETHEAESGKRGLIMAQTCKPELVILDLGLPDMDGIDVIKALRKWSTIPVIILSARTLEHEKVAALNAGADDYLTKPFGVDELLARMRVALRHASLVGHMPEGTFTSGPINVDLEHRHVYREGEEVHLTPIEYRLLVALIRHAGKVVTQRQLITDVWGPAHVENTHYLRIYMGALRQKLERDPARPQILLTETGVGYRLVSE